MSLGTDIIDLMAKAEARGLEISEITLSERQRDFLIAEFNCADPLHTGYPDKLLTFNGARIVARPEPKKTLATQLRALADQVEKLL